MPLPAVIQRNLEMKRFIGVFQGIAPSTPLKQTSTLQITAAYNFLEFYLVLGNLTAAMIQQVRLKIGGDVIQRWAGTDLDTRLQYDKVPASSVNQILTIPLRRLGVRGGFDLIDFSRQMFIPGTARDLATESSLNCGSAGGGFSAIENVSIEVDVVNTGASQPTLSVFSRCTSPIPGGPGAVYRVDQQTKTISNGTVTITKPEMGLDALRPYLNRISFFANDVSTTFDNFLVRYGTNDWFQVSAALLAQTATMDGLRVTQTGLYVIDFQEQGWGDTVLDLSNPNADILIQFTAAGITTQPTMTYYPESIGAPFAANMISA